MLLSERQWRDIKAVQWNTLETKRIRERIHDDKFMVGWCPRRERWVLARLIDTVVAISFGVRTIPTRETAPFIWKAWEDDDGNALHVRDPRLISYIRRCDIWRMGMDKYMLQYDHTDWLEECRNRSEEDELGYIAKQAYKEIKKDADALCGYTPRFGTSQKHFFQSNYTH